MIIYIDYECSMYDDVQMVNDGVMMVLEDRAAIKRCVKIKKKHSVMIRRLKRGVKTTASR
jgi:hypothetical protein